MGWPLLMRDEDDFAYDASFNEQLVRSSRFVQWESVRD